MSEIRMLCPEDIFDVYACEYMLSKIDDSEVKATLECRVNEIHSYYLVVAKERIRAEARFLGVKDASNTIAGMLESIRSSLTKKMSTGAINPDNLLDSIIGARTAIGMKVDDLPAHLRPRQQTPVAQPGVDARWFKSASVKRITEDPRWYEIAKAFLDLESATTTNAKIQAIDHLNDLQHNSFHLLIDLQSGRMLGGGAKSAVSHDEAVANVKKVLDIKRNARTPAEYLKETSSEVQRIWRKNRALM